MVKDGHRNRNPLCVTVILELYTTGKAESRNPKKVFTPIYRDFCEGLNFTGIALLDIVKFVGRSF